MADNDSLLREIASLRIVMQQEREASEARLSQERNEREAEKARLLQKLEASEARVL
jgi:hypothetical protein